MHRCFLVATLLFATSTLSSVAVLHAQVPQPTLPGTTSTNDSTESDRPTTSTGVDDGVLSAGVSTGGGTSSPSPAPQPPGPVTYEPRCTWTVINQENTAGVEDATTQIEDDQGRRGWIRDCTGTRNGGGPVTVWVAPAPDPVTLVGPASERARARLPLPTPVQSPAPEVGSVVNLGLWLSIEDPGVTTARADLAGVWAEATGRFAGFTIDPGDKSPVIVCEEFGVAYKEGSNDPDEGPCGHTYLQPSPDGKPYIVTYTITYDITWRTSDGRSGSYGSFDRSFSFPFDVTEIQTVGTGG